MISAILGFVLISISSVVAGLNKAALRDSFDRIQLFDFLQPSSKSIVRLQIEVPELCAKETGIDQETGLNKRCPDTMEVWHMDFSDCGEPWTLCRCSSSTSPAQETLEAVARIPVAIRRMIGTFLVFPDGADHAFTRGGIDIFFFRQPRYLAYLHEAMHTIGFDLKNTTEWRTAIDLDSCVVDKYADSSLAEAWAQAAVFVAFKVLHGKLPDGYNDPCWASQRAYMENLPILQMPSLQSQDCFMQDEWTDRAIHKTSPNKQQDATSSAEISSLTPVQLDAVPVSIASTRSSTKFSSTPERRENSLSILTNPARFSRTLGSLDQPGSSSSARKHQFTSYGWPGVLLILLVGCI